MVFLFEKKNKFVQPQDTLKLSRKKVMKNIGFMVTRILKIKNPNLSISYTTKREGGYG